MAAPVDYWPKQMREGDVSRSGDDQSGLCCIHRRRSHTHTHALLTDITGCLSLRVEEGPSKDCAACIARIQTIASDLPTPQTYTMSQDLGNMTIS